VPRILAVTDIALFQDIACARCFAWRLTRAYPSFCELAATRGPRGALYCLLGSCGSPGIAGATASRRGAPVPDLLLLGNKALWQPLKGLPQAASAMKKLFTGRRAFHLNDAPTSYLSRRTRTQAGKTLPPLTASACFPCSATPAWVSPSTIPYCLYHAGCYTAARTRGARHTPRAFCF